MEKKKKIINLHFKTFLCLVAMFISSVFCTSVFAATLQIYPASSTCYVGETCPIDVLVSSTDQAMNAVSGVIIFPESKLQVASLSKVDSIFSFWIQEPSFTATSSTFEGIVLNPGFTGSPGNIISIVFNAVSSGTANLSFLSGDVLANDGEGTSILEDLQDGILNIETRPEDEDDEDDSEDDDEPDDDGDDDDTPTDPGDTDDDTGGDTDTGGVSNQLPLSPEISSPTHPNSDNWYSNGTAIFNWPSLEDIENVKISISPILGDEPLNIYSATNSKEFTVTDDGIWYLHAQLKNNNGWGEVSHFRFQVDTKKPTYFNIERLVSEEKLSGEFLFDAYDDTSGIDHYVIVIDKQEPIIWWDDGTHIFKTSKLMPGEHLITVSVVDKANNFIVSSERMYIDPLDNSSVNQYLEPKEEEDEDIGVWDIEGPVATKITPVVTYTGIGFGVGQALFLVANTKSLLDIWLILLRLLSFLSSFFRRRKSEPWGVVYDSVTKQPLDPAYVSISAVDRKEDNMAITDLEGRYGFLVDGGKYVIKANKTHYVFPSEKLKGKTKDELYKNLYFGETIDVKEESKDLVSYNIPLDPVGFDWNEYAKKEQGYVKTNFKRKRIMRILSNFVFFSGFILSTYLLWVQPVMINFGLFVLYALIFIFQEFWKKARPITKLLEADSNKPVAFAIIKAFVDGNDVLLKTVVTDENGRFYILTPPGKYYLTVEIKLEDGSYSLPYRTMPVPLKKGIVLKNLYINKKQKGLT